MAQESVKALALSSIGSAAVGVAYAAVNAAGFPHAPFFIRINNASNAAITISYDGVTDNEYLPANGIFELGSQTNSQPNAQVALFPKYTVVYVKGVPGVGTIYLSGYYV